MAEMGDAVSHARAENVIRLVGEGASLQDSCTRSDISVFKFKSILDRVRSLALSYARARELRADLLADQIIDIADSDGDPQRARNRIQARQWLASKHAQSTYGDRIDLNVSQSLSITDVLAEARARRQRLSCDQGQVIEAQVIETPAISEHGPTDCISEGPMCDEGKLPDIFS